MRKSLSAVLVLALLPMPLQAKLKEPIKLRPSSVWAMHYVEDSCRLVRLFGEGGEQVRLEFRGFAPGSGLWTLVSGNPIGRARRGTAPIAYRFNPDKKDIQDFALTGELEDKSPSAIFKISLATAEQQRTKAKVFRKDPASAMGMRNDFDIAREAEVNELQIDPAMMPRFALDLGSMAAPMAAMRACLDDLLASWGVDPAIQGTHGSGIGPVPARDPRKWFASGDYPQAMLRKGQVDKVDFRLTVDETGKPTDCAVLTMESIEDFMKATCDKLMQRSKFEPATGPDGKSVKGIWVNSVSWIIP